MRSFFLLFTLSCFFSPLTHAKDIKKHRQLLFIENKGQVTDQYHIPRSDIDFKVSGNGISMFISNNELHYQFYRGTADNSSTTYRMDVTLMNANEQAKVITAGEQPYYEQYYTTGTPATAHSFTKITYKDVYPSIDWVLYIADGQLEYDFIVHKGGNVADIKLSYNGATNLSVNNDGSLTATTPMGNITEAAPYSYQEDGKQIASSFLLNDNILAFKTSSHKGKLTIDPKLEWSTYYGGENTDYETEVACNDSGYVYIAGSTSSINNIATVGSHQSTYGGGMYDVFLAKFNGAGERLWATYYGGDVNIYSERFVTLTCDHFNNVYVAGRTQSTNGIATPGSHKETLSTNADDAFLVKFNSQGTRIWGTYYGGDSGDVAQAVICDDSGNVIITGVTLSDNGISTPGSYQELISLPFILTEPEAFLAKFDSTGVRQWGTYYGGAGSEWGYALATDDNGCIYLAGSATSSSDIATPGTHQPALSGLQDAFIAKFSNSGERIWATYYGGVGEYEVGTGLVIDGAKLYLCGNTDSPDDIATPGSHQTVFGGIVDAFLVKFDTAGNREWGTYYGGSLHDANQQSLGHKLALDNTGNIYMAYGTNSTTDISTPGAPQENYGGGVNQWDVFLVKFNGMGVRDWATYFGGCSYEVVGSCAADNFGNVYIAGLSGSDHMGTRGCFRDFKENIWDAFLAKFSNDIHQLNGEDTLCAGSNTTYYASFVPGAESYTWTLPNGWTGTSTVDTINVTVGTVSGTVSVVANKSCSTEPAQEMYVTVHPLPVPIITRPYIALWAQPWFVTYQWYSTTGGAIAGATADSFSTSPGDYFVVVTDTNGCTAQSDTFTITLSVTNSEHLNNINLHPNPNTGNFTLTAGNLAFSKTAFINITDITGRKILQQEVQVINNTINHNIALPKDIPAGQYFLKLTTQEMNRTIKFTKH